jgi:hypothetical protein
VEVTLDDMVRSSEGNTLIMQGNDMRPPVLLEALDPADKIQWDASKKSPKPLDPLEQNAYLDLQKKVENSGGSLKAAVTGPLKKVGDGFVLEVRKVE